MLFGRKSERLLRPAEPGIGGWTAISTIDTGIPTLKNRCAPGIPGRSSAAIHFNGRAIFLKKRVAGPSGKSETMLLTGSEEPLTADVITEE
jgi:hypothetical protein